MKTNQANPTEEPTEATIEKGGGGLKQLKVKTRHSTAEIYFQGAHVAGFQKNGEPALLFLSRKSAFAEGKPIRGGVPVCFPWFGARAGDAMHGFARTTEWELLGSSVTAEGAAVARFRLPMPPARESWAALCTEFTVTVANVLELELSAKNDSASPVEIENCLHTYIAVGDINEVSINGLIGTPYLDYAAGGGGARKVGEAASLRITRETNRIYPNTTGAVEIHDAKWRRAVRVEKFNSNSTVVWNPWTTQKMPDDFDPAEHRQMVCVESGNVGPNKITLLPGQTARLKLVLSSRPL